jgi:RNA polymerase sigma-70 factor (ECF subfamily)
MNPNRPIPDPVPDPPDVELLRRCAAGDADALRRLFDRYKQSLGRYLCTLLQSREDAEETVADVFVKAWQGAAQFRGSASVRSWLYAIATHAALDRLRARRRTTPTPTPHSDLDEPLRAAEDAEPETVLLHAYERQRDRRALCRALSRLDPEDRMLIALRHSEGCSYRQIQEITGEKLANVRIRLHRARQRLRSHFTALRESDEDLEPLDETLEDLSLDPVCLLAY